MLIIPAIDLRDGKCVQLVGGVFGSEQIVIKDVLSVAKDFFDKNIKRLHIIDLNAAKEQGDNLTIIKEILGTKPKGVEIEVGGGVRDIKKTKKLIFLGTDYIILGTAVVKDFELLKKISSEIGKEKIIVSLDYKNKKVLTNGWDISTELSPLELGKKMQDFCSSFLVTCVDKEGLLQGPDFDYLKELVDSLKIPIIASGGISTIKDLKKLKEIGVFGAVIGMALYKGNVDLREALKLNDYC